MSGVEGKVVAITGASSGIGAVTATLLAEHGAKVVLGARRIDRLEGLVRGITEAGGEAVCAAVDVRQRADSELLVASALEKFGRLDVFVANAGVGVMSPLDALWVDEWVDTIDINVKGILHGIAAALPVFRKQGNGHFVHMLSTSGPRV